MCGIVGGVAERNVVPILIEGLRRLEYRGYDSAGLAVLNEKGIDRARAVGKVQNLADLVAEEGVAGVYGIAHTRWATHGKPAERNAHPHVSEDRIVLVHNGIIENAFDLREAMQAQGVVFSSETDTEVVVHLLAQESKKTSDWLQAVKNTLAKLHGSFALAILNKDIPGRMIVAREGSPLVIGLGFGEKFVASDQMALLPVTQQFIFLEEGDVADITKDSLTIYDRQWRRLESSERPVVQSNLTNDSVSKGEYRHFMLKEIHEQPSLIAESLEGRLLPNGVVSNLLGPDSDDMLGSIEAIKVVGCGTSFLSGEVARYWLEYLVDMPCQVEIASEFRYRQPSMFKNTLMVFISQSGETADTLSAMREAKARGFKTLAVVNVPESSMVREADMVLLTRAGREMSVASTKGFTTQLVAMMLLVLAIGKAKGNLKDEDAQVLVNELRALPDTLRQVLTKDDEIQQMAQKLALKDNAMFLGRGFMYPIAEEGALKMKELSYIHAEAYPAGELKHGPLALIDDKMPVVSVAPNDVLWAKLKSNLEEVSARGGELFVFSAAGMIDPSEFEHARYHNICLPIQLNSLAPVAYVVPLQLLAYHTAVIRGTDVDQPRNLAKSVTVE